MFEQQARKQPRSCKCTCPVGVQLYLHANCTLCEDTHTGMGFDVAVSLPDDINRFSRKHYVLLSTRIRGLRLLHGLTATV